MQTSRFFSRGFFSRGFFSRGSLSQCFPLALLLIAAALPLPALADENGSIRSISVSGEAERRVAPDMATLSMDVVTEAEDAALARREECIHR